MPTPPSLPPSRSQPRPHTRRAALGALALTAALVGCPGGAVVRHDAPPPTAPFLTSDWSTFQRDDRRAGARANAPVLKRAPRIAWSAKVGAQAPSHSPLLVGGMVIVPTHGDTAGEGDRGDGVRALRRRDGGQVWRLDTGEDVHAASYGSGIVVAVGPRSTWAIDARTGKLVWSLRQRAGRAGAIQAAPLIIGPRVVTADSRGRLTARVLATGEALWTVQIGGPVVRGLARDGDHIIVATRNGVLAAHSLRDGRRLWDARDTLPPRLRGARYLAAPTIDATRRRVIVTHDTPAEDATPRPALYTLRLGDGKLLATSRKLPTLRRGGRVLSPGYEGAGGLTASVNIAHHRYNVPQPNKDFLFGVFHSRLRDVDYIAGMGPCMKTAPASPVSAQGTVYVPRTDGALYAVALDHPLAPGFPRWRLFLGEHSRAGEPYPKENKIGDVRCDEHPNVGKPLVSAPAVAPSGALYITSAEGFLYKLTPTPAAQPRPSSASPASQTR